MQRVGPVSIVLSAALWLASSTASAATNQFRGVNWADPRDNFQSGVVYLSGLSSADTYASASAVADRVVGQFVSELGSNSVRLPINEATVSQYWSTYTGAIDMALSKGKVILCFWSSSSGAKPPDIDQYWSMWATVVDKYGSNPNAYFEVFNEPSGYSTTDLGNLYATWLTKFPSVPQGRVILDGGGLAQNVPAIGSDSRFSACLLAVHDYTFFASTSWTAASQWESQFQSEVGNYADRTVCTEWGAPMSPGSKNGISYGVQNYDDPPGSYFVAYVQGISSQLRTWNMGSFFWPGLRDGDWYSMTVKTGSGSSITLSVSNPSGLDRLQYAWGGVGSVDAGSLADSGSPSDATARDDSGIEDAGSENDSAPSLRDGSATDATNAVDGASSSSNPSSGSSTTAPPPASGAPASGAFSGAPSSSGSASAPSDRSESAPGCATTSQPRSGRGELSLLGILVGFGFLRRRKTGALGPSEKDPRFELPSTLGRPQESWAVARDEDHLFLEARACRPRPHFVGDRHEGRHVDPVEVGGRRSRRSAS